MTIYNVPGTTIPDLLAASPAPATPYDGRAFLDDLVLALDPPDKAPNRALWRPLAVSPSSDGEPVLELYPGAFAALAGRLLDRYDPVTALHRYARFRAVLDLVARHYAALEEAGLFVVGPSYFEADEATLDALCKDVLERETLGHGALATPGDPVVALAPSNSENAEG